MENFKSGSFTEDNAQMLADTRAFCLSVKGNFHDLRQETRLLAFFLSAVVGVYMDSVAKRKIATTMQQIHIGNLIRNELRRQGHTNEWLADRIGVNIRTVNKIFLKQNIDTSQLYRISKVLDTDFFSVYSNILSILPNKGKLPTLGRENVK